MRHLNIAARLLLLSALLAACGPGNQDLVGKCVHYMDEVMKVTHIGDDGQAVIEDPPAYTQAWGLSRSRVLELEVSCPY